MLLPLHEARQGFAVLRRTFKTGDVITLTLPMKVKATRSGLTTASEWSVGPLVYAFPIETQWTSVVEAAYTFSQVSDMGSESGRQLELWYCRGSCESRHPG